MTCAGTCGSATWCSSKTMVHRPGATLSHSHSQLIAVPLTPPVATTELKICREFFASKERCIFCDLINFELVCGDRVVKEFANYVILTPYAACFPFELRLYPKRHSHDFALMNDERAGGVGRRHERYAAAD